MLFNSYGFIFLFLPLTLLVFFWLARFGHRISALWLAAVSLFFYGYWNPAYVGLLLASIIFNYGVGIYLVKILKESRHVAKQRVLTTAVIINLALLGYYKYTGFFVSNLSAITGSSVAFKEIILPLGISFFTFTQIAFLVDTSKGYVKEVNFIRYTLFVTYFPHLIAGPVLHHKEMMPQFADSKTYAVRWDNVATGILLFTVGLFKKVVWADSFAPFVTAFFDGVSSGTATGQLPTAYEAWGGALAYTLQIYFDFSGYTDMALGIALMFNIRLPINFNSPYKATSIIEFWRRWHITLSTFLKDYLYFPMGGNRHGQNRRYINLLATMVLGGLWHGASWTFVIWGALHGAFLVVNHAWRWFCGSILPRGYTAWIPSWSLTLAGGVLTFIAVTIAWVVFRASDMTQAQTILNAMFGIASQPVSANNLSTANVMPVTNMSARDLLRLLIPGLLWVWILPNSTRVRFIDRSIFLCVVQIALVLYILYTCIEKFGSYSPFLYFQF